MNEDFNKTSITFVWKGKCMATDTDTRCEGYVVQSNQEWQTGFPMKQGVTHDQVGLLSEGIPGIDWGDQGKKRAHLYGFALWVTNLNVLDMVIENRERHSLDSLLCSSLGPKELAESENFRCYKEDDARMLWKPLNEGLRRPRTTPKDSVYCYSPCSTTQPSAYCSLEKQQTRKKKGEVTEYDNFWPKMKEAK